MIFTDFGASLERDARRFVLFLFVLVVFAAGAGMGLYHLFIAK